jgi:hypothetical protein
MIGSLLFLAVFVAEDVFSPDFNWLSTAVSEHSRTPHGWIQVKNHTIAQLDALPLLSSRCVAYDDPHLGEDF